MHLRYTATSAAVRISLSFDRSIVVTPRCDFNRLVPVHLDAALPHSRDERLGLQVAVVAPCPILFEDSASVCWFQVRAARSDEPGRTKLPLGAARWYALRTHIAEEESK